jgi:hypothetical protein
VTSLDRGAAVRCVDAFVPGWLVSTGGSVPVLYGMAGTRPRHDGPHVGVHCEPDGLVVNAWHPTVSGPLPIGPRGLGVVVPWGTPPPPEPGWLDDPDWEMQVIEGVADAIDTVLAHQHGRVCGASHPGREDRCLRPEWHEATADCPWWGSHATVGLVWDNPDQSEHRPTTPARQETAA